MVAPVKFNSKEDLYRFSELASKENYGINIADTVQIGLTNDMGTVQIGLLNGRGCVQIGLWNYCPGSYIPYFPLINFDMGKKE